MHGILFGRWIRMGQLDIATRTVWMLKVNYCNTTLLLGKTLTAYSNLLWHKTAKPPDGREG